MYFTYFCVVNFLMHINLTEGPVHLEWLISFRNLTPSPFTSNLPNHLFSYIYYRCVCMCLCVWIISVAQSREIWCSAWRKLNFRKIWVLDPDQIDHETTRFVSLALISATVSMKITSKFFLCHSLHNIWLFLCFAGADSVNTHTILCAHFMTKLWNRKCMPHNVTDIQRAYY